MILPCVENDDRVPFRDALVDLVGVDGHAAYSEGWPSSRANCATPMKEPAGASAGTCTTAQGGYSQGVGQLRWAISRAPPGTMRSALLTRTVTGMTGAGVVRTGSSVGCFQSVYTGSRRFNHRDHISTSEG